jgi:hypothetical protein
MATNAILTPTMITRESLRILHQKLNFIGNVNRQYDDKFAVDGAKIGTSLNIRMPAKYTVRETATLAAQNHVERSTPLTVSSQYGVDVSFTTAELTMDLDRFSERVLDPAMSQLAAHIENACLQDAYKLVSNYTNASTDALMTYKIFQQGGAALTKNLAPLSQRCTLMGPDSSVEFMNAVKGLFQDSTNIKRAYREGQMGRTGGFDVFENTLIPSHTTGSMDASTPVLDGANQGTSDTSNVWSSETVVSMNGTATQTIVAGDILQFAGLYAVHPESKANTGVLQNFVSQDTKTLTTGATTYTITVKPALIYGTGNAYKNCVLSGVSDTNDLTITRAGAASTAFGQDLQFHKDAFVFATADLEDVSKYGAWGARAQQDGISMRIAKQYAIGTDTVPCRLDVLFGFAGLYPELANRHMYDLSLL